MELKQSVLREVSERGSLPKFSIRQTQKFGCMGQRTRNYIGAKPTVVVAAALVSYRRMAQDIFGMEKPVDPKSSPDFANPEATQQTGI